MLVVEDNVVNQTVAARMLDKLSYAVHLAVMSPDEMRALVAAFLEDAWAVLVDLDSARSRGDLPSWRRIAHKLRGSCATLGARGMVHVTRGMEALDEEGLPSQGRSLSDQLAAELSSVEVALRSPG